jgi:arginine decarboxylase
VQLPQQTAPYLEALTSYAFRDPTRFHVPGHKGGPGADAGLRHAMGEAALTLDVAQGIEEIDVGPPPTPYDRAETLAADLYGARQTWFLSNGASQGNHALCLTLAPEGAEVIAQRNSHGSLVDGLVLSGGVPHWVAPEYDDDLGMAHGVTSEAVAAALAAAPEARAVFVVSPTYYGMAADVAGCADAAHDAGAALIVDQAWGPHFGFHRAVPRSALQDGADAALTSTHKMVGSLTQSAMLHVADTDRVDDERLARMVRLMRSTSPNSLLLASLDAARRQIAIHGQDLLGRTVAAAVREVEAIDAIDGCRVVGADLVGRPGVAGHDPLRIVIDVRGTGCTGYEVSQALQRGSDVYVELATHATIVLVLGLGQPVGPLERFAHDLEAELDEIRKPGTAAILAQPETTLSAETAVAPREAFLRPGEVLAVDDAVGRISAESIAGYPPGIPALLPGERITAEVVEYLRALASAGARLHGASDPAFRTITVLQETR